LLSDASQAVEHRRKWAESWRSKLSGVLLTLSWGNGDGGITFTIGTMGNFNGDERGNDK